MGTTTTDALVIGAGAIGASAAYHLSRRGLSVVVVEQFDGPAEGSTGRSFASVRGQWADPLNVAVSWRSIEAFRDFPAEHGIDVGYVASGYLFLHGESTWDAARDAVELQRSFGVPVEVIDVDAAQELTPFEAGRIAGITWGPADGAVDPHGVTSAYLALARRNGADVRFRRPVTAVRPAGDDLVVEAGRDEIHAGVVVNAAGGWSGEVASLAGVEVPVHHSRRSIFASAARAVPGRRPMTIDMATGVFLRSEGERLLFGGPPSPRHLGYSTAVDWPWMEELLALGVESFPWLADLPLDRSACWGGTYEMSPDHQGILGRHPEVPALYNACGFSGHGLMQSPVLGELVAEDVVDGVITSLDVAPLRIERFADPGLDSTIGMTF
ncbi:MAG: FAD-dependent oxidoreductase [Actinomycetales bacterium]|nr:FAD-dependent oxidoreductase [Actinomycetales bacterium]